MASSPFWYQTDGTLNLNTHFHMLFLDGVYIDSTGGTRDHPMALCLPRIYC